MSTLVLPQSMVADRDAGIKANAQHVDDNFNALATAVNGKLDLDGTSTPTADITLGNHKLTNVATPTLSGDAATKGYVDSELTSYSARNLTFSGTVNATTQATSDNSTKLATTEFVTNVLKAIYPVGSMFIGTSATCPLATLFGTWEVVATNIVTSVNNSASVAGNGISLGLTNGNTDYGLIISEYSAGVRTGAYGAALGQTGSANYDNYRHNLGVTTDSTKSGLSATVTSSSLTLKIWKRTA